MLRRLQLLYHHGYLERPRAQLDYYNQGGSREIVYGLGDKGAALLRSELGAPASRIRWSEKNRSVGRIYLEHALLVSEVMVAIELACRRCGDVRFIATDELLALPEKDGKPQRFRWNINLTDGVKLGVVPDRVFALEYTAQFGITERAYFFFEADRGTMPVVRANLSQTSFYRKLLAYEATWSHAIHRTRFGFHRFRVLTITKSAERSHSLVQACSRLSSGHGLFLFADYKSLRNSVDILGTVWKTGRQGETTSLLA